MHKASQGDIVETRRILERWEGQYVLAGPHSDGSAVARFSAPGAQKEVLDALGGGVRGQYRLSRVGANTGNTSPPHAPCFDHSDMNMSTSCFFTCAQCTFTCLFTAGEGATSRHCLFSAHQQAPRQRQPPGALQAARRRQRRQQRPTAAAAAGSRALWASQRSLRTCSPRTAPQV